MPHHGWSLRMSHYVERTSGSWSFKTNHNLTPNSNLGRSFGYFVTSKPSYSCYDDDDDNDNDEPVDRGCSDYTDTAGDIVW